MNNRLAGKDIKLEYLTDDGDWVEVANMTTSLDAKTENLIKSLPKLTSIINAKTRTSRGDRVRKRQGWMK